MDEKVRELKRILNNHKYDVNNLKIETILQESNNFKGVITFNEVGADVFTMLDGVNSVDKIVETISAKYDAPSEIVKEDVLNFIEKMKAQGLVEE